MKQKKFIVLIAVVLVLVMSVALLTSCANIKFKNAYQGYSYRMGPSDIPTSWNLHTYQSNSSTYVLDYAGDSLYTFDYKDENCDSFTIVPSMASGYPVDITAEVAADPEKAALWNLYSDGLVATAAADGEYVVEPDAIDENGIVAEDDLYSYQAAYDSYIAAGVLVRVSVAKAPATEDRVYKINLKHNLKFDNGEAITASTFVESMGLLLQPDAANFRADNVYKTGSLKIANAEEYFKAGKQTLEDLTTNGTGVGKGKYTGWDNTAAGYGLTEAMQKELFFVTGTNSYVGNWAFNWSDGEDGAFSYAYLAKTYGGAAESRTVLEAAYNEMNEKSLYDLLQTGAGYEYTYEDADGNEQSAKLLYKAAIDYLIEFWCTDPDEEFGFFTAWYTWPELPLSAIGFYADPDDDYALVIVLKNAMDDNFYLRYELCTSFFLVNPTLYRACISYDQDVYTNSYGTSVDTFIGYGPYKLTQYVADSTIILERNEYWHGYDPTDDTYLEGAYQTDRIVYTKVTENSTRLEMFLKGELDGYGLQPEDMNDYLSSPYTVFTDSESTWYLAMNPDEENLTEVQEAVDPQTPGNAVVKTVLCIDDFRKALSYSIDREQFNLTLSPTSGIAKALLSAMIIADPEEGLAYRNYDEAKDAILSFWGLADQWGEGKKYPTRDAAIDSITGYDPEGAKALFNAAYTQAVAAGYITEAMGDAWEVQIVIGKPSEHKFYNNGYDFLKANWTKAVEGTSFEGHLVFIQSQTLGSTTFGSYLRNGSIDLLFGVGYGGSMFDPYSMIGCFTDGGNLQYDAFTDTSKISLDVVLDLGDGEKTYRASLASWVNDCLSGNAIDAGIIVDGEVTGTVKISAGTSDPSSRRIKILAAAEEAIMNIANVFPLQTDASASLHCMRINYKTDEYVLGMGFGGVKYMTYNLTDQEFLKAAYKQKGHKLNYK